MNRRTVLKNISLGIGAVGISGMAMPFKDAVADTPPLLSLKGTINHSVCRWCFQSMPLGQFAEAAEEMGIEAIDLLRPEEWDVVVKAGLRCSLATDTFANIGKGFNRKEHHKPLQKQYRELISKASDAGIKQVIVFSGNRNGLSDAAGLEMCAKGLEPLVKHAEKKKVTLVMELLNSKVDHADYQCDNTSWGVALVDKIGAPGFRLLYDIYHMQVMEGDVIATIRKYHTHIAHYHTAGVPGRHELDTNQELYYPAIMRAIAETGFKGYVAQEFIPTYPEPLNALKEAIAICDV